MRACGRLPHATYQASGSSSDSGWVLEPPWGHTRCLSKKGRAGDRAPSLIKGFGKRPGEGIRLVDHHHVARVGELDDPNTRSLQFIAIQEHLAAGAADERPRDRQADEEFAHYRPAAGDQSDGAPMDGAWVALSEGRRPLAIGGDELGVAGGNPGSLGLARDLLTAEPGR